MLPGMSRTETSRSERAVSDTGGDNSSKRPKGRKRQKVNSTNQSNEVSAAPMDFVRIVPVSKKVRDPDELGLNSVVLSGSDKASQLQLAADKLSVSGTKGYRTARATHGAREGTWYCEATATFLGPTGHCRIGWCTGKAELQAPVGYDKYGYSYRDLEGSKVHKALREPYGEAYAEGDVVGLFIHLPPGKLVEKQEKEYAKYKGGIYEVREPEREPEPLLSSVIAFSRNGVSQGVAFNDVLEGTYFPAASLYTKLNQTEAATVTFNFGPDFKYSPLTVEGCPPPKAFVELAAMASVQEEMKAESDAEKAVAEDANPLQTEPERSPMDQVDAGSLEVKLEN